MRPPLINIMMGQLSEAECALYLRNTDAMVSIDKLRVGLQHVADFGDLDKTSVNPRTTALMHICINGHGQSMRCVYPWYTWYDGKPY